MGMRIRAGTTQTDEAKTLELPADWSVSQDGQHVTVAPGGSISANTEAQWYGAWNTSGNGLGSIGFAGTPTAAPATTVGSGGVTLPLTNGTVPVAECSVL